MRNKFWLYLLVTVGNWWFWRMVRFDLVVASLCLLLSLLLLSAVDNNSFGKKVRLMGFLFVLLVAISLFKGSDRGLFITQPLENDLIEKRHEYFAKEFGVFYKNRIGIFYLKKFNPIFFRLQKNFFANLDIGLYFFSSHPRERVGVDEFAKYPAILLPVFMIGFIFVLRKRQFLLLLLLLAGLVSIFLHPVYNLGPVLFFPLINTVIFFGYWILFKGRIKKSEI
ncbi:hypothetical protein A2188_00610 [Candidatus Woesebacteria bacterium RIFOXYA1_FULL_43_9]|uniref:Uncharacterized protein n=1 Tax=Candidatus Woesebacteria bacterium RIFOXYA1_FULL_43_9 TaxID=1802534 RepID=A0A1F8CMT7_9BACT|nr:MAG: hypothetical protein A2188_00610 [Candidatus Woesebacteria bacterium RIFOXYA1_FULL_43_9]